MKTAPVAELKANLSRYLSRVKAGEEVLVTERGTPIARLVPVSPIAEAEDDLRELVRQGLVRLGTGRLPRNFWKLPRPRDPEGRLVQALLKEREEGR
jgi:prevent-host-death family protein